MLGDSSTWTTIIGNATTLVGGYIGTFAPVLAVIVGLFAFGIVVTLVVRAVQKNTGS